MTIPNVIAGAIIDTVTFGNAVVDAINDHTNRFGLYLPLTGGTLTGELTIKRNSFNQLKFDRTESDSVDHTVSIGPSYNTVNGDKITLFMVVINGKNLLRVRENETTDLMGSFTTTGDVNVGGVVTTGAGEGVFFGGNWEGGRIYNTTADNREYMVIGNRSDNGAQLNLYGDNGNDEGHARIYTGGNEALNIDKDQNTRLRGDLEIDGKIDGTTTIDGSIYDGYELYLSGGGGGRSVLSNNTGVNRELLQIRGHLPEGVGAGDALQYAAGINVYGDTDTSSPGQIRMYTGNQTRLKITIDGVTTIYGTFVAPNTLFGIANGIDTADIRNRAQTATMPALDDDDDDDDAASDLNDVVTVNEVVTALLAKVRQLEDRLAALAA